MNLFQILDNLSKADPEVLDRLDTRRAGMREFARMGTKAALAALPLAFGSMFRKAYGGTNATVVEVLNYALTLEYLEAEFYKAAVARGTALIPAGAPTQAITTIRDHEIAHVQFLKSAITSLGGTPVNMPNFDFSGGSGSGNGPFADAFTNYPLFLAVAQTFEDTGVRAYKGRAAELMSNNDVLQAALQIHAVEARHASHIRYMRRTTGQEAGNKPWISGKTPPAAAVQASYDGEENTMQAGVNIATLPGSSTTIATEAFDEPLTESQVLAIVGIFIG